MLTSVSPTAGSLRVLTLGVCSSWPSQGQGKCRTGRERKEIENKLRPCMERVREYVSVCSPIEGGELWFPQAALRDCLNFDARNGLEMNWSASFPLTCGLVSSSRTTPPSATGLTTWLFKSSLVYWFALGSRVVPHIIRSPRLRPARTV